LLLSLTCSRCRIQSAAADCPGNPRARTERVLESIRRGPLRSAASNFPDVAATPKEIVLTFDDGPWPGAPTAC